MGINESVIAEQLFVDRVVAILLKEGENLKEGKEPNYHFWVFFYDFMVEYLEKHHMYKQEKLLKRLLIKELQAEPKERIEQILSEHEQNRKFAMLLNIILGESFGKNDTTLLGLKNIILSYEERYSHHAGEEMYFVRHYIENHFHESDFKEFEALFEEYMGTAKVEELAKRVKRLENAYNSCN